MKTTAFEVEEKKLNRKVIHENPKILKVGEVFSFDNKFYSSIDESLILKSTSTTGKLFAPIC